MATNGHYDVIIIGTGAGGGTLAYALAGTGKRILMLERGKWLPREQENWDTRELFINEPYYTRAEHLYAVHGERGTDPTEPPSSDPYPWPAMSHEPRIQEVNEGLRRQGVRTFPLPVGIQLDEEHPESSTCIRCNTFDGFPCPLNGKADAATMCVIPALRHPNVSLMTEAFVTRLRTDPTGRFVTAIDVQHPSGPMQLSADIVVVACGAVNSAALLLRSADDKHPNGLANSSDQ